MDVTKLTDLELAKLIGQENQKLSQAQFNVIALQKELERREALIVGQKAKPTADVKEG